MSGTASIGSCCNEYKPNATVRITPRRTMARKLRAHSIIRCMLFLSQILACENGLQVERTRFHDRFPYLQPILHFHEVPHDIAGRDPARLEFRRRLLNENDSFIAHRLNGPGRHRKRLTAEGCRKVDVSEHV